LMIFTVTLWTWRELARLFIFLLNAIEWES